MHAIPALPLSRTHISRSLSHHSTSQLQTPEAFQNSFQIHFSQILYVDSKSVIQVCISLTKRSFRSSSHLCHSSVFPTILFNAFITGFVTPPGFTTALQVPTI